MKCQTSEELWNYVLKNLRVDEILGIISSNSSSVDVSTWSMASSFLSKASTYQGTNQLGFI